MMVSTPKVSIIIRTLNEAAFLPSLLDLINNQSYKNFEIIIVDSGSKDDTREEAPAAFYCGIRRHVHHSGPRQLFQ